MQKDIRSYILNRVQSPLMTVEQFNWDNLTAPRIADLFTPNDLSELHNVATSLRLSARTKEKINIIDNIMRSRGFVRFISGTNRLTYRFIEDTSFLAKVAYNKIGTGDAPREFRNQMILKPFVPKVFECTPDGVLSIQERVEPITNREEFLSVIEDVYTLTTEWLIGEYVFDDIGTNYFMNYGIRKGFGVVLLDFPYMFKVDYGKLICAAKDKTGKTLSGTCEGEIDYDYGFNKIYCTKCGTVYTASDLAKQVEQEKVLIKPTIGGIGKMFFNINITGGSRDVNVKEIISDDKFNTKVPNLPVAPVKDIEPVKEEPVVEEDSVEEQVVEEEPVVEAEPVEEEPANTDVMNLNVNGVSVTSNSINKVEVETEIEEPKKDVICPMTIVDDKPESSNEEVSKAIDEAISKEDMDKMFKSNESEENKVDLIKKYIKELNKEEFAEILDYIFNEFDDISIYTNEENTDIKIDTITIEDEELSALSISINPKIQIFDDFVDIKDNSLDINIPVFDIINIIKRSKAMTDPDAKYNGFNEYAAEIINKKDIDTNSDDATVYALIAENGNYLTDDFGNIICVVKVNNKNVANATLISNNRLSNMRPQNETKEVNDLKPGATAQ